MRNRLLAALLLSTALSVAPLPGLFNPPAYAVTTTQTALTFGTWTNLGAGPLQISGNGLAVFVISDSTPGLTAGTGYPVPTVGPIPVNTTSNVWASPVSNLGPTVNVFTAPITASGGGGGGTATQGPTGTNAAAWWVQLGDTTHGPVAVKPASTAAVAGDPSLVIGISPNSLLPAFAANPTIANTSFGISGTLPAFASPPTFTLSGPFGASTTQNNSVAFTEGGAAPVTGATIPAGGVGIIGWLSAIWQAATNPLAAQTSGAATPIGAVYICDGANTSNPATPCVTVKAASTAPVAADKALVVTPNPNNAANTVPYIANNSTQYPSGSTAQSISNTGTTAATTATMAGAASNYTFLCGFSIRANATAAATGNATVTGTITGTLNFTQWTAPLASGLGVTEEIFTPCLPSASTGANQIVVISAAPGSGGIVSVSAWGYYKTTTP